jgi:manganese/zinc/iron transport system permease protein
VQIIIMVIAAITASSCALLGNFLVVQGASLISDAISHSILFGIALMFLVTGTISSPLLFWGAVASGGLSVVMVRLLGRWAKIKEDVAIGVVFPAFFSAGVVLICLYANQVHLDIDMVLLGDLVFVPFDRLRFSGVDWGPRAFWIASVLFIINSGGICIFYRSLVATSFDPIYAQVIGMNPARIRIFFILLVSVNAVAAFEIVGSLVVIALLIVPPATAFLISTSMHQMITGSLVFALISSTVGCSVAFYSDVSIAGSIAVTCSLVFATVLLKGFLKELVLK